MALPSTIPWNKQPQVAVGVDSGNPLSSELIAGFTPISPHVNLVGGSFTVQNYTEGLTPVGRAGLASSASVPVVQSSLSVSGDRTVLLYGTVIAASTIVWFTSSSAAGVGYWVGAIGAYRQFTIGGGISSVATSNGVTPDVFVATKRGTTHTLYVNGRPENSATTVYGDGTGMSFLGFGTSSGYNVTASTGLCNLGLVWKRALSASEVAFISVNPWQIFAPLRRRIWAPAAAGGASNAPRYFHRTQAGMS